MPYIHRYNTRLAPVLDERECTVAGTIAGECVPYDPSDDAYWSCGVFGDELGGLWARGRARVGGHIVLVPFGGWEAAAAEHNTAPHVFVGAWKDALRGMSSYVDFEPRMLWVERYVALTYGLFKIPEPRRSAVRDAIIAGDYTDVLPWPVAPEMTPEAAEYLGGQDHLRFDLGGGEIYPVDLADIPKSVRHEVLAKYFAGAQAEAFRLSQRAETDADAALLFGARHRPVVASWLKDALAQTRALDEPWRGGLTRTRRDSLPAVRTEDIEGGKRNVRAVLDRLHLRRLREFAAAPHTPLAQAPDWFDPASGWRPLLTQHDLDCEAEDMRHCVATYGEKIASGECSVFSIPSTDAHGRYTLEVVGADTVSLLAAYNLPASDDDFDVITTQLTTMQRKGGASC